MMNYDNDYLSFIYNYLFFGIDYDLQWRFQDSLKRGGGGRIIYFLVTTKKKGIKNGTTAAEFCGMTKKINKR